VAPTLDAVLLEGWADVATTALERHRAHIDRINVFPVADRDTGTNLLLTMRAAAAAVRADALVGGTSGVQPRGAVATAEALARGALRGARGNSGVILSQVLRGVAEAVAAAARAGGECGGGVLVDALARASRLATGAVSRPRQGTVLTVLAAAAAAARTTRSDRLDEVAVAAARAAAAAVRDTPGQLPELARAGVVDAGGLGLCVVLDALAALVTDREPAPSAQLVTVPPAQRTAHERRPGAAPEPAYEVMYLLDGSDHDRVAALRTALDGLGDAIAVVGDGTPGGGTWTVHVHCTDIGAAVEAGVAAGRPHGIRVVPLVERAPDGDVRYPRARAVLAVTCGPHVAALARGSGADVLERDCPGPGDPAADVDEAALERALAATGARHVALLPCDAALGPVSERAAAAARRAGQEVVVVPATSAVAGLAALAVHDPARHPADDVVAMTEAAAGTRTGAVQVAESEALTWAGRCRPGDVLCLADGEVVLIAPDVSVGALWLASRMVTAGGELVTVLLGAGVPDALGEGLAAELHRSHPEVDVVVHRGARPGVPVELGVE
jgi:DAK2 domain fusion protein YloV